MEQLLTRLQLVAGKIAGDSQEEGEVPLILQEYDMFYKNSVEPFLAVCGKEETLNKLGGVTEMAFKSQRDVVDATTQCAKPSDAELMALLKPIVDCVTAAQDPDNRSPTFEQDKAYAESIQCMNWLMVTTTKPTILGQLEASEFYLNKVLVKAKNLEDPTKTNFRDFVKLLKQLLKDLADFAGTHFKGGLTWKFKGIPTSEFKPGERAAATTGGAGNSPEEIIQGVISKLEVYASKMGGGDDDGEGDPLCVTAYNEYYQASVTPFLEACAKLEGTKKIGDLCKQAWTHQGAVIKATGGFKKPPMDVFMKFLTPIVEAINASSNPDKRAECGNQECAWAEAIQALQWLVGDVTQGSPPPRGFITGQLEAGDFYMMKVLTAAKAASDADKATMREFVSTMKGMLNGLAEYCFTHFKTGLEWNMRSGADGATLSASAAAAPAAAAPAAAAKPANPLAAMIANKAAGGDAKTANPLAAMIANKAAGGGAAPKKAGFAKKFAAPPKEPKIDTSKKHKIFVENYTNAPEPITVEVPTENGSPKTGVFVDKCKNSTIIIKGKCKNITLSGCVGAGVVFDSCVTTVELINCQKTSVQALDSAGTFTIDKCDRTKVYIPQGSLEKGDVLVYTTQSMSTNVYQPTEDGDDMIEYGVPEQLVSEFKESPAPNVTNVVIPDAE